MLIHTFVRTGELRFARWDELDITSKEWLIPANRMKMSEEHIVPLTTQTLDLLEQIREYNGNREFVFASPQRPKQAISENAIINCFTEWVIKVKQQGMVFDQQRVQYLTSLILILRFLVILRVS